MPVFQGKINVAELAFILVDFLKIIETLNST